MCKKTNDTEDELRTRMRERRRGREESGRQKASERIIRLLLSVLSKLIFAICV